MSRHTKNVAKKLAAQGSAPFALALLYAWWSVQSLPEEARAASFVNTLCVAFFLTMWFVGQWLRASKQVSDAAQLSAIRAGIAEIGAKLVGEGEAPKLNTVSPHIKHETAHYKLYSNGLLVQYLKLQVAPGTDVFPLIYPITFPNELISIQTVGDHAAWPSRASLGNCELRIFPSSNEQEIQLIISGI